MVTFSDVSDGIIMLMTFDTMLATLSVFLNRWMLSLTSYQYLNDVTNTLCLQHCPRRICSVPFHYWCTQKEYTAANQLSAFSMQLVTNATGDECDIDGESWLQLKLISHVKSIHDQSLITKFELTEHSSLFHKQLFRARVWLFLYLSVWIGLDLECWRLLL